MQSRYSRARFRTAGSQRPWRSSRRLSASAAAMCRRAISRPWRATSRIPGSE